MERNAGNIVAMALEDHDRVRIRRFDVVELDIVATGCGEIAFVRCNAEAIYLRFGMLDCARADARESFPEAAGSVG